MVAMNDRYITLKQPGSDEVTINKSRFIGYASPCATEEEALAFLKSIRDRHKDARHHCYAYVIGKNKGIMRYSDDGEPAGTAGLPMMDVLKSRDVVDCAVVVVRYFGGVLLGTGGLVRAYTQGCKIALDAAGPVSMELTKSYGCAVPYSCWDPMNYALEKTSARVTDVEYTDQIRFRLLVRAEDENQVLEILRSSTNRKVILSDPSEGYESWDLME